jgi:hypothetical protein
MTKTETIYRLIEASPFKQMTFAAVKKKSGMEGGIVSPILSAMVEQGKLNHAKMGKDGVYAINQEVKAKFYTFKN